MTRYLKAVPAAVALLLSAPALAGKPPQPIAQQVDRTSVDLATVEDGSFAVKFHGTLLAGSLYSLAFTQNGANVPLSAAIHGKTILTTVAGSGDYSTNFKYYGDNLIKFALPGDPAPEAGRYVGSVGSIDNVRVSFISPPIPEPATWMSLILGLVLVGAVARQRRGQRSPERFGTA